MSKGPVMVSAEETAKNKAFLEQMAASGTERYIRRHSKQARWTHGITIIACILLCISGLFVFVPALAAAAGADTVFAIRMSHRVIGVIFVIVPLISAIMAPKGVKHIFKNLFDRWDSDDKKWMMLFFPYLFMAKWIHMPDQREVKSGQRFADGMLWFAGALMGITGVILLLGTTLFDFGAVASRMHACASGSCASGKPSCRALSTHAFTILTACGYAKPMSSLAEQRIRRHAPGRSPASSSRAR